MKVIITEDIISNALNESIDEFMLEEGAFDGISKWWNKPYMQKVRNGVGKVWNGIKDAASMYMDKKTNGQWNQKYGIYVNGNTKSGELFYLNKWFNYYRQKLNSIIYNANTPDRRDEYDLYERDPETGKEFMKRNKYDYAGINGALNYAKTYCTPQNFNDYIQTLNPDRESVWHINTYIQNYINNQAKNGNLKAVLNNLNIYVFYSSNEFKQYMAMNRKKQQEKEKQRRINNSNKLPVQPFNYDGKQKDKLGWFLGKDANGRRIRIYPMNTTQAEFI